MHACMQGGSECSAEVKGNGGMGEWEKGRREKGEGEGLHSGQFNVVH